MNSETPRSPAAVEKLLGRVEWALEQRLPSRDVMAISRELIRGAPPGSAEARIGRLRLAQSSISTHPWRAALLARELTKDDPIAEEWGTLGLAFTQLGQWRAALSAYRRALALDPHCPVCCHNLGHLLDVALDRPEQALPYLERAYRLLEHEPEVASSFAHALLRAGRPARARSVLANALGDRGHARALLERWARISKAELGHSEQRNSRS